jgi:arsenate reductase (thioredoxin)
MASGMMNILILCTGNSCRSQIAHGYLAQMTKGKATVYSAGIETHGLNPHAISIMMEDGIDIFDHTSNHINEYKAIDFQYVITVCDHALENCPYFPSDAIRVHRNFKDPSKLNGTENEIHQAFETCRNEIKVFCEDFVKAILR